MRAKNEFRKIAASYDTKLILERVVDGKLMCPEACCGSPVMECKCGPDCPHCNCFMIHKAMKDKDFTDKLLKENLRQHRFFKKGIGSAVKEIFDIPKDEPKEDEEKRLRATNVQQMQIIDNDVKNLKISPEEAIKRTNFDPAYHKDLLRRYKKWAEREASFKDIKPASWYKTPEVKEPSLREILGLEDEEEIDIGTMVTWNQDGPMKGEVVDVDIEQGFAVIETGFADGRHVVDLGELTKATPRKPRSTITRFPAEENAEDDAGLWRDQMKHQPDVSPEEVERLKNRKPKPQSYSKKHPKREDNEELQVQVGSQVMWDRQRQHGIVDELDDPENPTVAFVLDDDGGESIVDVENIDVISGPIEDNEEPKRGITGYQHTDALAQAALSKEYKHKPYVSSFVGDGGKKIFAILGSDGKIVHKTHDKREAHQWLKDNYENI